MAAAKASHRYSTPAINRRRIVVVFGSEVLFSFDLEGASL
jgi:hypothetical protein